MTGLLLPALAGAFLFSFREPTRNELPALPTFERTLQLEPDAAASNMIYVGDSK